MSFSFGTPSSAPATTGLTGFSFGANKPATSSFGLSAASQPSTGLFGTPAASTTAFGTPSFGATSTAPAFGSTTNTAFTPASAFNAPKPTFGVSSATPAFGTTTPAFGSTAAPAFGATTTPAFGATSAAGFGATTTPSFGATGLGTGGLNFGAGSNTSAAATGLTFGAPAASSAGTGLGGLGGFGFGTATTAQSSGFGLFSSTNTSTTSSSLFGPKLGTIGGTGAQATTLVTPSLGLGGVAPTTGGIGAGNTTGDSKAQPPKQTKLPNEISANVDSFQEFVKKQKSLSSEVMRVSIKPLHKVSKDAEALVRSALSVRGGVCRARAHCKRMRAAAAAALAAADAANRDYSAAGTETESPPPPQYVRELMSELEQHLITFRRQMDVADKQMHSSPKLLTEQELTLGMRRMHEALVALAGRLQAAHAQVETQKEQYLNMRKYILKDPTNVFDAPHSNSGLDEMLRAADTSSKRLKSGISSEFGRRGAVLADPRAALGSIHQLAGPTPFSYVASSLSPFPNADMSVPSWQPQPQPTVNTMFNTSGAAAGVGVGAGGAMGNESASSAFQLQKPPGKRGKQ